MLEKDYYQIIKNKVERILSEKFSNFYLEITANKKFSNMIKAEIGSGKDIIFHFLKEASPDITGFIKKDSLTDFIVIEIKKDKIKLDHIYQTKKYRELFDAKFAILVSLESIPEEIKRLDKVMHELLHSSSYLKSFTLVHFDEKSSNFTEWYPENPFLRTY